MSLTNAVAQRARSALQYFMQWGLRQANDMHGTVHLDSHSQLKTQASDQGTFSAEIDERTVDLFGLVQLHKVTVDGSRVRFHGAPSDDLSQGLQDMQFWRTPEMGVGRLERMARGLGTASAAATSRMGLWMLNALASLCTPNAAALAELCAVLQDYVAVCAGEGLGGTVRAIPTGRLTGHTDHPLQLTPTMTLPPSEVEVGFFRGVTPPERWSAAKKAIAGAMRVKDVSPISAALPASADAPPTGIIKTFTDYLKDSDVKVQVDIREGSRRLSRIFPYQTILRVKPGTTFTVQGSIREGKGPRVGGITTSLSQPIEAEIGTTRVHLTNVTLDHHDRLVLQGNIRFPMLDRLAARLHRWGLPVPTSVPISLGSKFAHFIMWVLGSRITFDTRLDHIMVGSFTKGRGNGAGAAPRHVFEVLEELTSPMRIQVEPHTAAAVPYESYAALRQYVGPKVLAGRSPLQATLRFEAPHPNARPGEQRPSAPPLLHFTVDQKAPVQWSTNERQRQGTLTVHAEGCVDCNSATTEDPAPTCLVTTARLGVQPDDVAEPTFFDVNAGWEHRDNVVMVRVNTSNQGHNDLRPPRARPDQFATMSLVGRNTAAGTFDVEAASYSVPPQYAFLHVAEAFVAPAAHFDPNLATPRKRPAQAPRPAAAPQAPPHESDAPPTAP